LKNMDHASSAGPKQTRIYGYLSFDTHVTLGLEDVDRLVRVLTYELDQRGFATPFLFSTLSLEINAHTVQRLPRSFLATCTEYSGAVAEIQWMDKIRLAGFHELATCIRWGVARVIHSVDRRRERGLFSWRHTLIGANARPVRRRLLHPSRNHRAPLHPNSTRPSRLVLRGLHPPVPTAPALHYHQHPRLPCARRRPRTDFRLHAADARTALRPLFFGLGRAGLGFVHTYMHYARATSAMEHLILAYIRWRDSDTARSTVALLTQLARWVRGYPGLPPDHILAPAATESDRAPVPRPGAHKVCATRARRRADEPSPDLVHSGSAWPAALMSRAWQQAVPMAGGGACYADDFLRRMNLPTSFRPAGAPSVVMSDTDTDTDTDTTRFHSVAHRRWLEFEDGGFGARSCFTHELQQGIDEILRQARPCSHARPQLLNTSPTQASACTLDTKRATRA
jgi:hypothetical protein